MPARLEIVESGPKGMVVAYVRPNDRSPAQDFLSETPPHLLSRFRRVFAQFGQEGWSTASQLSFKPLNGNGKGIWTFKEHDHRLMCFRGPDQGSRETVVLLSGWVKDKDAGLAGSNEERREIEKALTLRSECEESVDMKAPPALGTKELQGLKEKFHGKAERPPVEAPAPPPAAPACPPVEQDKPKVPSRAELLRMAEKVIDGEVDGLEFLTLAEEYRTQRSVVEAEVARLEAEAARLAGLKAELARLKG